MGKVPKLSYLEKTLSVGLSLSLSNQVPLKHFIKQIRYKLNRNTTSMIKPKISVGNKTKIPKVAACEREQKIQRV